MGVPLSAPIHTPRSHGRALDAQPKDATGIKSRERRSRGRSVAVLYNTARPHSSLGGLAPAEFTNRPAKGIWTPKLSYLRPENGEHVT